MRIAVFSPFVHWPTHFGTELEIVQRHLEDGDEVTMLVCDGELPVCDVNMERDAARCTSCVAARGRGLALLAPGLTVESLQRYVPAEAHRQVMPSHFATHAELKGFERDGFDVGYAALSSLIFHLRDGGCDVVAHRAQVERLLQTAYQVYAGTRTFLQHHAIDRFYVFNGRFASARGVMRACRDAGVECHMHERGCDLQHYEVYPNVFPHDRAFIEHSIRTLWQAAGAQSNRDEVGAQWFRNKAVGVETWEKSFVLGQRPDQLPADWDPTRRNVAVFTSSEDEFSAIGDEWRNPLYDDELAGVEQIVQSLRDASENIHVYVRMHPNLSGLDNRQTRGLRALHAPNVTVIAPDAPESSYALMRQAEKVVTFGSTIGIEAVYWGVPSILAGHSFYRSLDATYTPASHEELMSLLRARLAPRDQLPALMYGFYCATYGVRFTYFHALNYDTGTFKGHKWWQPDVEAPA